MCEIVFASLGSMIALTTCLSTILLSMCMVQCSTYKIGVGIADMTGPPVEVTFMGYANMDQRGQGIHLRQFARTFIIDDGRQRLVIVSSECGMQGHFVRKQVLRILAKKYGDLYTERNVMMSGTHTHSTPGGFLMHLLFDITSLGFVPETFRAYVKGILRSIKRAHSNMVDGRISMSDGIVLDVNYNRSPTAYMENPYSERARYEYDVDKRMVQLRFESLDGQPLGCVTWYAVHATSMNNSNTLVSSDNLGYAAILVEQRMNPPETLIGKGPYVAAFIASNLGDVSPNIRGPRCHISGRQCDVQTSTCRKEHCIAVGPGRDMFESTKIIGERLAEAAMKLLKCEEAQNVTGPVKFVHQYVDMPSYSTTYDNDFTRIARQVRGCRPAMGYSFAAGTTDGVGSPLFQQGTVVVNPLWDAAKNFVLPASREQQECHYPKPILLSTGEMSFPYEWQPSVVSTHLATVGDVAIACVPGEFTTMAGRRLRDTLQEAFRFASDKQVLISGLCNSYSDYVVTPQEYNVQRYEGASTIFGPHTLTIYLDVYRRLAENIVQGVEPLGGPEPQEFYRSVMSLLPPVIVDYAGPFKDFGDVIQQPPSVVRPGDRVVVRFVGANPRNNLMQEYSYLTVERFDTPQWTVIATDANWETQFKWIRTNMIFGISEVEIVWDVPETVASGYYRIRHFGHERSMNGNIAAYQGSSEVFKVQT